MQARKPFLGGILVLTAVVTLAYWLNYFTGGDVKVVEARWYTAFEDAFPLSDFWMSVMSFIAGIGFMLGRSWAAPFSLLAGSALLFLAGMDITFNVENHLYALLAQSRAMQFELVINIWTLALGIWAIVAALPGLKR